MSESSSVKPDGGKRRRRHASHIGSRQSAACVRCQRTFDAATMQHWRDGLHCVRCAVEALEAERRPAAAELAREHAQLEVEARRQREQERRQAAGL